METNVIFLLVNAFLCVLAAGVSIYTLLIHQNLPDTSELQRQLNSLNSEFSDHFDKVQQWMRRDSTRRARAGKVDVGLNDDELQNTIGQLDTKAQLRAKLSKLRRGGN